MTQETKAKDCCYGVRPLSDCQCEKDRLAAATVLSTSQPERSDTTLYLERSKVREIVIGHNAATRAVLSKIDALPIFAAEDFRALAATPAVGGGLEALADHIEYEQARGIDIPMSDGEAAQIVAMLRAAPPASPLRGREILLALAKRHAEAIGELGEAQADKRSIDALSRNWLGGRVNGLAIALEVARVVVSASPPEQPAARPGYREYAALSIVEQAVKDMAGIGGDISGVTCQKMKKLIQTIEPCKRCGGSGWLETVECPNCDNGLVKSTPPEQPAATPAVCTRCQGSGLFQSGNQCYGCYGTGIDPAVVAQPHSQ